MKKKLKFKAKNYTPCAKEFVVVQNYQNIAPAPATQRDDSSKDFQDGGAAESLQSRIAFASLSKTDHHGRR